MSIERIEGKLQATDLRFALVISRFNEFFTEKLREGAVDCLVRHGASDDHITAVYVPGSFEIAPVAARLAASGRYDAVLCLGAVIRGGTPHFDYVAGEAAKGIARVAMDSKVPVIFGLVTADTIEQAIERSGTKAGNKGWDAAQSAIEMANLYRGLA